MFASDVFFSLKDKVLTWSVDLRGRRHIYVLGLFTQQLQSSFFSFKSEGHDLKGLSLKERKFDLRESLGGREKGALGGEFVRALK